MVYDVCMIYGAYSMVVRCVIQMMPISDMSYVDVFSVDVMIECVIRNACRASCTYEIYILYIYRDYRYKKIKNTE